MIHFNTTVAHAVAMSNTLQACRSVSSSCRTHFISDWRSAVVPFSCCYATCPHSSLRVPQGDAAPLCPCALLTEGQRHEGFCFRSSADFLASFCRIPRLYNQLPRSVDRSLLSRARLVQFKHITFIFSRGVDLPATIIHNMFRLALTVGLLCAVQNAAAHVSMAFRLISACSAVPTDGHEQPNSLSKQAPWHQRKY